MSAAQAKRLPEYARSWSRGRSLTYRPDEPPVADLRDSVSGKTGALRLVLDTPTGGVVLDARIRSLDWDDFQLGSGLSEYLGRWRVYFGVTDTLGSPALVGAKRIETALAAAGVAFRPEVEERRDFWPPTSVRGETGPEGV